MHLQSMWAPRLRVLGALLDAGRAAQVAITQGPNRLQVNWHSSQGLHFCTCHSLDGLDRLQSNRQRNRGTRHREPGTWEVWLRVLGQQLDEAAIDPAEIVGEKEGLRWSISSAEGTAGGWRAGRELLEENQARARCRAAPAAAV